MKVRVRLFARARELAECSVLELDLPANATIADLRRRLGADVPALLGILESSAFAVNERLAESVTEALSPDAEVALLPPVSGGESLILDR
jgi:molybdopterin synthase catalytic subunit